MAIYKNFKAFYLYFWREWPWWIQNVAQSLPKQFYIDGLEFSWELDAVPSLFHVDKTFSLFVAVFLFLVVRLEEGLTNAALFLAIKSVGPLFCAIFTCSFLLWLNFFVIWRPLQKLFFLKNPPLYLPRLYYIHRFKFQEGFFPRMDKELVQYVCSFQNSAAARQQTVSLRETNFLEFYV